MISFVSDENIRLTDSICGRKVRAYINAYGTSYDFCRLYFADSGGYILIYNSTMTLDGEFDAEELENFIHIADPYAVEMSSEIPLHLEDDYTKRIHFLYKYAGDDLHEELSGIRVNEGYDDVFAILHESFGMRNHSAWYTDLSHRVRHGVSNVYLYKTSTATMFFDISGAGFITHVATAEADRGKGNAGKLIKYLCEEFKRCGKDVYVYCREDRRTFYEMLGFVYEKDEFVFIKN